MLVRLAERPRALLRRELLLFDESGEGGGASGSVYLRPTDGSRRRAPGRRDRRGAFARRRVGADPNPAPSRPSFVLVPVRAGQPRRFPPDGLGQPAYGAFFPDGSKFRLRSERARPRNAVCTSSRFGRRSPRDQRRKGSTQRASSFRRTARWIAAIGPDFRVRPLSLRREARRRELAASKPATSRGLVGGRQEPLRRAAGNPLHGRPDRRRDGPCELRCASSPAATPRESPRSGPARVTPDGRTMTLGLNRDPLDALPDQEPPMTLAAGTKLGPYEILAPLGAGGMGEVYRARDARLKRDVAIKVLPATFSQDAGPPAALRAGGAGGGRPEPSRTSRRSTTSGRTTARRTSSRSCSKARRCASGSVRRSDLRRARRSTTRCRSRRGSPRRTRRGSSTAT